MLLEGKNAVLTGSSRGIGFSILEALALNGANIWACRRTKTKEFEQSIDNLSKKNKVLIKPLYFDLENQDAVKDSAKTIISSREKIDILINNAGIIHTSAFQMTRIEDVKKVFQVNFFSQILFTQMLVRAMTKQKKGSIVNISSSAGIDGGEGRMAYSSSKAALIVATKVMSNELGKLGIRVNAIAPGLTDTDMMNESTSEDILNKTIESLAIKRIAQPSEIASVAVFLASDLASYITGQVIRVDGGM